MKMNACNREANQLQAFYSWVEGVSQHFTITLQDLQKYYKFVTEFAK